MEIMREIPDESADMILCDLPYGTTRHRWDKRLPMFPLWREYWRVARPGAVIALTAQQPFATDLINSSRRQFRYELIWEKPCALGFLNARRMPLRSHENILIFYKRLPKYRPQMTAGKPYLRKSAGGMRFVNGSGYNDIGIDNSGVRYPRSVLRFGKSGHSGHPTEKPLALFEWLIKTYTDEGDLVIDNCLGSGTTAVVCETNKRRWLGIERELEYCEMAKERLISLSLP
jgi:site-specific DNA-methyltransferase (adenine-specific)